MINFKIYYLYINIFLLRKTYTPIKKVWGGEKYHPLLEKFYGLN